MPTKKKQSTKLAVVKEIDDKIYIMRNQRVMMDSDLAEIYGVTTKRLNEQLRRNVDRFPADFVFQLNDEEFESLRSQNATSNKERGGRRYLPYAFTEHGAVMLASVLNSPTAVEASIEVVRVFVKMRSVLALHKDLAKKVERLAQVAQDHENEFEVVWELLGDIMRDPKYLKRKIGFVEPKKKKK
ncbi:MAG: ORF6N domain-containing protein [Pyrinomonadaceae bacterium]